MILMSSRTEITSAKRLVIKVGSSSLTSVGGGLNIERVQSIIAAIAAAQANSVQVVLVSSGAVAAGLPALKLTARPTDLAQQQAAASIGQGLLIAQYAAAAAAQGFAVGQVLLTQEDITRRSNYRNAKQTFEALLQLKVLPIVNENDVVATAELKYGDNDRIAALVTHLVDADALLILTDVAGLMDGSPADPASNRIAELESLADFEALGIDTNQRSKVGSGGMRSKLEAAAIAASGGVPTLICHVDQLAAALAGESIGTLFHASTINNSARSLWLAHASVARGKVVIDAGAVAALKDRGASLLAAGVTEVVGAFDAGEPIDVVTAQGVSVARGLASFGSDDLLQMMGKSTAQLAQVMGEEFARPAVHRDDLVLLDDPSNSLKP
jgi:glutamate 5-kinase